MKIEHRGGLTITTVDHSGESFMTKMLSGLSLWFRGAMNIHRLKRLSQQSKGEGIHDLRAGKSK